MSSNDESLILFLKESEKLKKTIYHWNQNIENLSMSQIIDLYYQVINVNSLVKYSQKIYENPKEEINVQITNTQKIIDEEFDQNLHPKILKKIEGLVDTTKNNLKENQNQNSKTKEEIEKQAEKYEELRKMMSTKEFVEQYHKTINN
ncbi:MAG: hypothetical protein R3237_00960 [Nitrosopumilaceae archaeon]|nr:hypothetical protein [Nitrosopumilaceae archaeon]